MEAKSQRAQRQQPKIQCEKQIQTKELTKTSQNMNEKFYKEICSMERYQVEILEMKNCIENTKSKNDQREERS